MADSRQSIFNAAKQAAHVNPNAENFYKPGSWQHKAWADGVQAVPGELFIPPPTREHIRILTEESKRCSDRKRFQRLIQKISVINARYGVI